jgi:hypothetical protein
MTLLGSRAQHNKSIFYDEAMRLGFCSEVSSYLEIESGFVHYYSYQACIDSYLLHCSVITNHAQY